MDQTHLAEKHFRKGMKVWKQDLTAQTAHHLGKGLKLDPGNPALWCIYGMALSEMARYEEAMKAFRRALARVDRRYEAHICSAYADSLEVQGRLRLAEKWKT